MSQNAELVTRKCALESGLQSKEKMVQKLTDRVKELEAVVMQFE